MTLRTGHGTGAGVPRVEVLPADELPVGVPGPARPEATRGNNGRFARGAGTSEMARAGGLAARESRRLAQLLGLTTLDETHPYAPYSRFARDWRDEHMAELASNVAGGRVGPGPAAIVSNAALQMGASRFLFDLGAQTSNAKLLTEASKLADSARQNVLAAHELAAKEATARGKQRANPTHARILSAGTTKDGAQ